MRDSIIQIRRRNAIERKASGLNASRKKFWLQPKNECSKVVEQTFLPLAFRLLALCLRNIMRQENFKNSISIEL